MSPIFIAPSPKTHTNRTVFSAPEVPFPALIPSQARTVRAVRHCLLGEKAIIVLRGELEQQARAQCPGPHWKPPLSAS